LVNKVKKHHLKTIEKICFYRVLSFSTWGVRKHHKRSYKISSRNLEKAQSTYLPTQRHLFFPDAGAPGASASVHKAGISTHGRYQPHGQWRHLEVDATGWDWAYGWFSVGYHVSGVSRPGRAGHSDPQRPSTGSIWRPISRPTGDWIFRWIGPLE
jgi:hypothetical protein